eukprot:m.219299 g.219299  ORF g.219299 m.219299 type:complete len:107 (+) comp15914_c0_seq3:453-773(+)
MSEIKGALLKNSLAFTYMCNRYLPFQAFITETITRFKTDSRVKWWEIFNEPHGAWSLGLRNQGVVNHCSTAPLCKSTLLFSSYGQRQSTPLLPSYPVGMIITTQTL